ncbi:hypothetical protein HDU79_009387 [Rhizoclosmatium sp. JEL0117]|nr:hypothetical protein HDU79_009387 [Rhizoclosmatium sp. JEL0117]
MHPPPWNPNHHVIQVTRQSTSELTEIDETEHGLVVRNHRAQSDLLLNHPMWAAVAHGSLEAIKTETEKPTEKGIGPCGLVERGGEGETILHVAILKQRPFEIIQWIVTTFPTLVNVPYAGKRYFGETALHLAVVQAEDHNPAEHKKSIVRLLIEHEADPNISLATGTEFASIDQGTLRYYGQSVLHFAVVSGKPLIVEYLVSNDADIMKDDGADKNNVLHLLAKNSSMKRGVFTKMFRFFKTLEPKLLTMENEKGQNPLTLGIAMRNANILEAVKDILWDFDKVCRYRVPLNGIDPLLTPHDKKHYNLIQMAVESKDKDILTHPVINTLLQYKWKLYAQYYFLGRLLLGAILIGVFFTPAIAMQPPTFEDRRSYDMSTTEDRARLVFEVLTLAGGMILMYFSSNDVFRKWNVFDNFWRWSFGIAVLSVPVIRAAAPLSVGIHIENVVLGVAAIIGWIYLLSFAKGSQKIGPLVQIVATIVSHDFIQWLVIYVPITVGFGTAMFLQLQDVPNSDWNTNFGSFLSAVRFQFQEESYTDFKQGKMQGFSIGLMVVYGFLATLLLSNILISKLVNTFERIHDDSEREWKLDLARAILTIDLQMPDKTKGKYIEKMGFHVVEISNGLRKQSTERYFQFTERIEPDGSGNITSEVLQVVVGRKYLDADKQMTDKYEEEVRTGEQLEHFRGLWKEWIAFWEFWGFISSKSTKK